MDAIPFLPDGASLRALLHLPIETGLVIDFDSELKFAEYTSLRRPLAGAEESFLYRSDAFSHYYPFVTNRRSWNWNLKMSCRIVCMRSG